MDFHEFTEDVIEVLPWHKKPKVRKTLSFILVGLVVLLAIFFFWLSDIINSSRQSNESEGIVEDPTIKWETYSVEELGLTFRYPSDRYEIVNCPGYISAVYRSPKIPSLNLCDSTNSNLKILKRPVRYTIVEKDGYAVHKSSSIIAGVESQKFMAINNNENSPISITQTKILATSPSLSVIFLIPQERYVLDATINIFGSGGSGDLDTLEKVVNTFIFNLETGKPEVSR